jgi:hypothetical protein
MTFFSKFPLIRYDINKDGSIKTATDILRRVAIRKEIIDNSNFFENYAVQDGETPEMVAHKFYNNAKLHWVVLLTNQIIDPYFDWCLGSRSLENFLDKKYPEKAYYINNISGGTGFTKDTEVYNVSDRSVRGFVESWDPTYRKLVLRDTVGSFSVDDIIQYENTTTGTISRIVDIHKESLHHFENLDGKKINPYGTPPVGGTGEQVLVGQTGASPYDITAATFGNTILHSYLISEDGNLSTHTTVTNREYEENLNTSKQEIKILKEELIPNIDAELKRMINL